MEKIRETYLAVGILSVIGRGQGGGGRQLWEWDRERERWR